MNTFCEMKSPPFKLKPTPNPRVRRTGGTRERVLRCQPGPNPLHHRDDYVDRPRAMGVRIPFSRQPYIYIPRDPAEAFGVCGPGVMWGVRWLFSLWFWGQGLRYGVWGLGSRVQGPGSRVQGSGFRVHGFGGCLRVVKP